MPTARSTAPVVPRPRTRSIRPRTWAGSATAARSRPTTRSSPTASAACARTGARTTGAFAEIATNSRLSELEAAALRIGLRRLEDGNRRRGEIAAAYRAAGPGLRWQPDHPRHAYHLCVARVPDRDRFRAAMPFETAVHYPRTITAEPAYAGFRRAPTPHDPRRGPPNASAFPATRS